MKTRPIPVHAVKVLDYRFIIAKMSTAVRALVIKGFSH
jgi:hypothetical protein